MPDAPKLPLMPYQRPVLQTYQTNMQALVQKIKESQNEALVDLYLEWDRQKRELCFQRELNYVRFTGNTQDEKAREEKKFFDENTPFFDEADDLVLQAFLAHPHAQVLSEKFGTRLLQLLHLKKEMFSPEAIPFEQEEGKLSSAHSQLISQVEIIYRGGIYNLSSLAKFYTDKERNIREETIKLHHDFFASKQQELDELYVGLVKARDQKAKALGFSSFIPLAYKQLGRVDYGEKEVERFREAVVSYIVPLVHQLKEQQREKLGVDTLRLWDESVQDPKGAPKPLGDGTRLVAMTEKMYKELSPETNEFFQKMKEKELFDLESRPGKQGGGYCLSFDKYRLPFIFSNFNGSLHDVLVMTHECGHAFQYYMSRKQPIIEYYWPSMEAAEIYSMGMEFLTWPWMPLFFGKEAKRFCQEHLISSLTHIPYMAAVDEFQHKVFEGPVLDPQVFCQIWSELEKKYLPWRNLSGLPHWQEGHFWKTKTHIYQSPFYYIDYALAQLVALQMHFNYQQDPQQTKEKFMTACQLGGSCSFSEVLDKSGFKNPLQPNHVQAVVQAFEAFNPRSAP